MKRILATLMVVAMMISTMVVGTVPAAAAETDDAASKYVTLEGDWHYNLYRKYSAMFQYFAYSAAIANGSLLEGGHPEWPEKSTWETWEVISMPNEDNSLGGLHDNTVFPTWSESWVIKEFDLPEDFTDDEYVTLMMGIIDDNDVVYINGTPVAASGFLDGNGEPTLKIPEVGGFNYGAADKADQVKWETSYWERQREYSIPADVLIEGGTNVIGMRVFNNNSNCGFYSGDGKIYAICGNESAVRELKGLPSQKVDSPAIMNAVAAQNNALAAADIDAYAETISDNYHNDADTKEDKLAGIEAMMDAYTDITVADEKAAVYADDEGGYWYVADRTITGIPTDAEEAVVISSGAVETCFLANGEERGNWNRCYGTSYDSELFSQELTYSVYLPPSYYAEENKEYPVVWLLHGQNSSSTSYRDVDGIGSFMDNLINNGEIVEMVLIMPDSGKNAFYGDSEIPEDGNINEGGPWATQLTQELRAEAQANYRIMTEAEFNGLTGNSMGGFGSLNNGSLNPDLYSSIGLHMGYLPNSALENLKTLSAEQLEEYDFYVDAGLQDQTVGYMGSVAVHEYLDSMGKDHGYSLRDGSHNSAFYMSGMANSMKMHSDHFMKNGLFEDDADNYVELGGEWNYKLYRTYPNMFQYFPYVGVNVKWEDLETAVYPADGAWKNWDALQMPNDNPELGGLLNNELSPTWSEAWVVREFDLPMDFANSEEVTLLMGIIDDNDVIYINGTPVAASGFVDGSGNPTLNIPEAGGFNYDKTAAAEDQVKWSKSYWEIQREYTIPADVLNLGGTNEIAIRLYNNNSNGGFYSGNLYAICGNELAVRNVKGLPIDKVESPAVMATVEAQIAAIEAGDVEAFAATVADDYHNDAAVKADRVAQIETLVSAGAVTVEDTNAVVYKDDEGNFWYSAERTISVDGVPNTQNIELCYKVSGGEAKEIGNWNRCYGTSYASELFGENLTYSVYLPPSYYNTTKDYPVVWLLHGRASSSTSYRDVDDIGAFMDAQIASGKIVEMVLIMPDSGKYAFYQDSELTPGDKDNSGPWRTQLTEELRGVAQEAYRIKKEAAFNGLTGNSMGGFGAMVTGTLNPDLYSSIGVHMGFLGSWDGVSAMDSLKSLTAEQLAAYDFYLDCGLQDQTVGTSGTIAVHEYLESVGKAHGYDLRDGTHGSAFYMSGMGASMKMHSDHFKANGLFPAPSSGGSSTPTYTTTVEKTENGTISLSAKRVAAGKEVAINVKPDEGYEIKSITVLDAEGNKIEVVEKDGKFTFVMPNSKITIEAEFVEIGKECAAEKFDDLDANAWYHDAVDYVLTNGIMTGVAEDKFAPAASLTRGMVVQMLWAMEGKPAVDYAISFADVAADAWYTEAVRWAAAEGIVSGYSTEKFGANDAVTREQMAVMLSGYARYKDVDVTGGADISAYADASAVSDWAVAGLKWACGEGILSGKAGGYLDPTGTATRMEAAQMLMKFGAVLAD